MSKAEYFKSYDSRYLRFDEFAVKPLVLGDSYGNPAFHLPRALGDFALENVIPLIASDRVDFQWCTFGNNNPSSFRPEVMRDHKKRTYYTGKFYIPIEGWESDEDEPSKVTLEDSDTKILGELCDALQTNKTIKRFSLSNAQLNSEGFKKLQEFLSTNQTLEHFELIYGLKAVDEQVQIGIGERELAMVADGLRQNSHLKKVTLNVDFAALQQQVKFSEVLRDMAKLEAVEIKHLALAGEYMAFDGRAMMNLVSLPESKESFRNLSFEGCDFSDFSKEAVDFFIEKTMSLKELNFKNCKMSEYFKERIADLIANSSNLEVLSLTKCDFGLSASDKVFAAGLGSKTLKFLDLSLNRFDDPGVLRNIGKFTETKELIAGSHEHSYDLLLAKDLEIQRKLIAKKTGADVKEKENELMRQEDSRLDTQEAERTAEKQENALMKAEDKVKKDGQPKGILKKGPRTSASKTVTFGPDQIQTSK